MALSNDLRLQAEKIALSTCLLSWNSEHSFQMVLNRIGDNGSVVERMEYLGVSPEKTANTIRSHLESILKFAEQVQSSSTT